MPLSGLLNGADWSLFTHSTDTSVIGFNDQWSALWRAWSDDHWSQSQTYLMSAWTMTNQRCLIIRSSDRSVIGFNDHRFTLFTECFIVNWSQSQMYLLSAWTMTNQHNPLNNAQILAGNGRFLKFQYRMVSRSVLLTTLWPLNDRLKCYSKKKNYFTYYVCEKNLQWHACYHDGVLFCMTPSPSIGFVNVATVFHMIVTAAVFSFYSKLHNFFPQWVWYLPICFAEILEVIHVAASGWILCV